MNHYPRHIGDYARDCSHLTLLEHGVYARLLDLYYAQERGIDGSDFDLLARRLGARSAEEKEALKAILFEFFHPNTEGLLTNKRAENELNRYRNFGEQQRQRVAKRYSKPTDGIPTVETKLQKPTDGMPTVADGIPTVDLPYTNQNQNQNQNHNIPLSPPSGETAPKPSKSKRDVRELPDDWEPSEAHATIALAERKNLSREAQNFRDYHQARGTKFRSWNQAFNLWLRKSFGNTTNDHRSEKLSREFTESIQLPTI
jgi:uncharacterized protein YdaU (DUF1376 family)